MKKRNLRPGDIAFDSINYLILIFIGLITLYPFLHVLAISLNDGMDSIKGGIGIVPRVLSVASYRMIFEHPQLLSAVGMSLARTVVGLTISMTFTTMLAYVLTKRYLVGYKFFNTIFVMAMFLGAGLIPTFMNYKSLHLNNTFWVYVIPGAVNIWNMTLLRNSFDTLPDSLEESARLDGANDFQIFYRIVLPLSGPILATISLFVAVQQWNAWQDTLYYTSNDSLVTLQYLLMTVIKQAEAGQMAAQRLHGLPTIAKRLGQNVTPDSVKMAITMVATVPILCVYPFVQKYFVKGVMVGAIKE